MLAAVAEGDVDPVLLAGGGGIGAILRVAQGSPVLGAAASWSASWPAPWPVSLASLRMKPSSSWIFCITFSTVFDVPRDDLAGREVALAKKVRSLSPSVAPTPSPDHQPVQVLGPVRYPQSLPSLLNPRAQNSQTAAPPALRCLGVLLCA